MIIKDKSKAIILIEKLRLIESELFRLSSKYGVKTIEELDSFITRGFITEEVAGEDLFRFDYLISEKESLEKDLQKLSIPKSSIWTSLQHLLGLQKLSLQT